MKQLLFSLFFLIILAPLSFAEDITCDFGKVKFLTNYDTARINGCEEKSGDYVLSLSPETKPINPSPWYGFKVVSDKKRTITVILKYTYAKHRYWPKISHNGLRWDTLKASKIKIRKEGKEVRLRLSVDQAPLWVSAQEILNNKQYDIWGQFLAKKDFVTRSKIGHSVEGRPIYKLETTDDEGGEAPAVVLMVGRQHPPEVTGALAMLPFVETVLSDSDLAKRFRAQFRLVVVPNLNPDGVAHGHWRTNVNGQDLNRDWGPFTQPETQVMQTELNRFSGGGQGKIHLMLDFHSTHENLIYTQTDDDVTNPPNFAADWYGAIRQRMPDIPFKRDPRHNTNRPTSKGHVYKTYGAPAITYEMGDNSNRKNVRDLAIAAAEEMMTVLLKNSPE